MKGFEGKRIGIAAARRSDMIAALIEKNGGTASTFSIQGEQVLNKATCEQDLSHLFTEAFQLILLTTGIGAETLEKAARQMDRVPEFIGKLERTPLAVRGSKTLNWLKKHALTPSYIAGDGMMENLLDTLASEKFNDHPHVFLQAYNQDDDFLKEKLENLGYTVYLSKPYQYKKPDPGILRRLRQHIVEQTLDAVIFTSKTQVQNLFYGNKTKEMVDAFNNNVIAAAVGKVTAAELEQHGISDVFYPANQKMGAMVIELRDYYKASLK
ncbi:uroporphyrinogen-III synthase [Oceanobacillus sp. FSL K6-2867]|uniref:uroporphyrinogen-III synthase n=1 Tax=Oceanobacillus sp. FSL K6-2867 TaxID=2954748 RepID=UPI0030DA36BF